MIKYLAIYTITISFILQTTNGQILNKICKLPAKTGPCRAHMPRYFYNPTSSSCEKFIYGGCRGNENNFMDKNECINSCLEKETPNPKNSDLPEEICSMAKEIGFCRARLDRFYYNSISKSCEKFIYGGCGGNKNNFLDKSDCEASCLRTDNKSILKKKLNMSFPCNLPKKVGMCFAYFVRFYYKADEQRCVKFFYGGCRGNANNFSTIDECRKTCEVN